MNMDENIAEKIIEIGNNEGANLTEIFVERTRTSNVSMRDSKIETATSGIDYGIGIRLLYGSQALYGFTSDDAPESLLNLTRQIAATREQNKKSSNANQNPFLKKEVPSVQQIQRLPEKAGQSAKLHFLRLANETARKVSERIAQVSISAWDMNRHIRIFNSEGLDVSDHRVRCRFSISVTSEDKGERFSASQSPGALQGFEFFESLPIEQMATQVAESAMRMLYAKYITGKKMPVVLGNGFGGVIFHEACGHPLETEAIRRKASPFVNKLDSKIAHCAVTAIDDGTIKNSWGSISIDDEGHLPQKTTLIENGILKSYLSDRIGAMEVGVPRTGSARRESYQYAPVSRMRNTYIASGNDSLEDMIASIDEGLYALTMGGGSVNPATGEFNFAVQEGYRIKKGKVAEPVRGASLIGRGHEILPLISMVGNDMKLTAGMCGASSGSVPVTVGQPTIKVDEILVGGKDEDK